MLLAHSRHSGTFHEYYSQALLEVQFQRTNFVLSHFLFPVLLLNYLRMIRASLLLSRSPIFEFHAFAKFCFPFYIMQLITLLPQGLMVLFPCFPTELLCGCIWKRKQLPECRYRVSILCISSPLQLNMGDTGKLFTQ